MLVRFFQSIVLTIGGGAVLLYALTVLGWRRHGASPIDMTFLHLDWVLRPELPYWQAHMANLAIACIGLGMVAVGVVIGLSALLRLGRRARTSV
jgi:hypothetical protein